MTRDAINLTMSEPLRRAKVRQRLDALAQITGLAQAQLAGRALTIGLGHIEQDLSQIFPGVADNPSSAAPSNAPPRTAGHSEAQPGAAIQRTEAQHSAPVHTAAPEPAPPPDAVRATAPLTEDKHEPEPVAPPSESKPALVSTRDAARALGYRAPSGFTQHIGRHRELRRCGRKTGRAWVWDVAKLRAEYERSGWAPR